MVRRSRGAGGDRVGSIAGPTRSDHLLGALQQSLAYLRTTKSVASVDFQPGKVYIWFSERPLNRRLDEIVTQAALRGNAAYGFEVYVAALPVGSYVWEFGMGPYYCEASARDGISQGCL
jgi:hypothetical protein